MKSEPLDVSVQSTLVFTVKLTCNLLFNKMFLDGHIE